MENDPKMFWAMMMIGIGTFLSMSGVKKSQYPLYKWLVSRSKTLWGEQVHRFYMIIGLLIAIVGILMIYKVI